MRPPQLRFLALVALAALLAGIFVAPVQALWSHPAVPHYSPSTGSQTTTTTTTLKNPVNTQLFNKKPPISWNVTDPNFKLAFVTITTIGTGQTETVTTTQITNPDGSVTTTISRAITGATTTVTTILNNPPVTGLVTIAGGFYAQTVTTLPATVVNGVTTQMVRITFEPQSASPPLAPVVETISTVAVAATPPVTTVTSNTTPVATSKAPPGLLGGGNPPGDIEAAVKAASDEAQAAILVCPIDTPPCIADALDAYAAALQKLAPYLPPQLRTLPAIVAKAATKVRAAKTKAEAVQAVQTAIAEVHKTIALLKADDSATRQVGTREGTLVVQTLQVASDKLEKAVGL